MKLLRSLLEGCQGCIATGWLLVLALVVLAAVFAFVTMIGR